MRPLGPNQLALLLIIDEGTRFDADGEMLVYKVCLHETSIPYTGLDGSARSFFIMTPDLKSIDRLVDRGLVIKTRLRLGYAISQTGRALVQTLRATTSTAPPPTHGEDS